MELDWLAVSEEVFDTFAEDIDDFIVEDEQQFQERRYRRSHYAYHGDSDDIGSDYDDGYD